MGSNDKDRRHKHSSRDKDEEQKSTKKRHRHDRDEDDHGAHKSKKHKHRKDEALTVVDHDLNEDDMWVEKNIDMDGERPLATNIPTAASLALTSHASTSAADPPLPPDNPTETKLQRDEWMLLPSAPNQASSSSSRPVRAEVEVGDESLTEDYGESSAGGRTLGGGVDFFSNLGAERKRKPPPNERKIIEEPKISRMELNTELNPSSSLASVPSSSSISQNSKPTLGGPGSSWRMMRLRKVYETVEEEGRPLEEVAMERFGSLEKWEEVKEERRILDERGAGGRGRSGGERNEGGREGRGGGGRGMMFTEFPGSGASSRSGSYRKPGGPSAGPNSTSVSNPGTPAPQERHGQGVAAASNRRLDALRLPSTAGSPLAGRGVSVPSVLTPPPAARLASSGPALDQSALNKLQAKVLRAKLMNDPKAADMEKEYDEAMKRSNGIEVDEDGKRTKVEVLPTLDGRGRLYDVGHGASNQPDEVTRAGNRRKKEAKVETRDPKTGDVVRINADDDEMTLGEMLRQEKFSAGQADQKDMDAEFARQIMGDGKFEDNEDYLDENAEKLGRKKMRSEAVKRGFAIQDYARTQKALDTCQFCFSANDDPPKAPVISMGTRAYLSCTLNEELTQGHCLIVPIQHHLCLLEGDDDVWDEVRNFMKCLMRMYSEEEEGGRGVIFYETVISFKRQSHSFIECVPVPWEVYDTLPGYYRESILNSEAEWSTHKKLIDFSKRPGGFRRSMVPNLPYFMVSWDYKGEKGYGHVIEGPVTADDQDDGYGGGEEGEKGGGEFPRWFAGEVIGNVMELEPRRWRRPRKIDFGRSKTRVKEFRVRWAKYDWTGMIGKE